MGERKIASCRLLQEIHPAEIQNFNDVSVPQWLNFNFFLVGCPTKNDEETKQFCFFTRETD